MLLLLRILTRKYVFCDNTGVVIVEVLPGTGDQFDESVELSHKIAPAPNPVEGVMESIADPLPQIPYVLVLMLVKAGCVTTVQLATFEHDNELELVQVKVTELAVKPL